MSRREWKAWLNDEKSIEYRFTDFVGYKNGKFTIILSKTSPYDNEKLVLDWDNIYSYKVTNESYREDVWVTTEDMKNNDNIGIVYRFDDSDFLRQFRNDNEMYKDYRISHFIVVSEDVIDVLSSGAPNISYLNTKTPNRFENIYGEYVDTINGQTKFGFSLTGLEDLFDIQKGYDTTGEYKGNIIRFYDMFTGKVYEPFPLEKNIAYGGNVYFSNDFYYFLRVKLEENLLEIIEYLPQEEPYILKSFSLKELNLYNISICGNGINLISQDGNQFESYYPKRLSLELPDNESVYFIDKNNLYIGAWIEEGFDEETGSPSDDYRYYNKFIIRDLEGNLISEEIGNLFQNGDGFWWIS
ncbi:hypothetical protein [Helcococcus kunzii]|uniref:hypothetical protein n=1 Tax=Helcococcus kunzii TaxID=40091 RepID=UPI001BB01D6F|nr:hypothetical protein [Helcococcus kunzii]QUY65672.1 hypothetical protein GUI37_09125 [Helcococcus kunzii]